MKTIRFKLCLLLAVLSTTIAFGQTKQPNIIVVLADDMGYGDLSSYGHPTIRTPNLDKMAAEGMRFTQFYAGAAVCTPSRAALLTGRLSIRTGVYGKPDVFRQNSASGLPSSEVTIAEMLKTKGYATSIVGKWHLGHLPEFMPMQQGFDNWFGTPYSNDMGKIFTTRFDPAWPQGNQPRANVAPLQLFRNDKVVEEEPDQRLLTQKYTQEAIKFIQTNQKSKKPFFLYYASNFPHTPLYASKNFEGKSKRGIYGDVVEELDWSVGELLKELKKLKIDDNTIVVFTSDNGPWLFHKDHAGSAGLLYEGKNSSYEGGMRVPAIAWWPGKIKPNVVSEEIVSMMDLLPTFASIAQVPLPKNKELDGIDISDVLFGKRTQVRNLIHYYLNENLYAVRKGPWKAHFITHASYSPEAPVVHETPLLYNLNEDPSEKYNIAKQHPEVVEDLKKEYQKMKSVVPVPSEIDKILTSTQPK